MINSSQDTDMPGGWDPSHFKSMPQKLSQIVHPPPTGTFVFIDEHEDSIDDGLWNTPPSGLVAPGVPVLTLGWAPGWGNFLAVRHNQGANIAFADGRVDHHKWLWPNWKWTADGSHVVEIVNQLDQQDLIYMLMLCPVETGP